MDETTAEVLILAINALGAGILLFISGVVQKIMNDMDEPAFRWFLNHLDRSAMTNPLAVTVATLPLIAAIFYFMAYGFGHWWFTAGFAVWLAGSAVTKITNMPAYAWVGDPANTDPGELARQRRRLKLGNTLRAWLTFASVVLMACQFSVRDVVIVLVASAIIAVPLLWLARQYVPGENG